MRRLSTRAAGLLIVILGIWGGLVPFIGPYFHFTLGPTKSWTWTSGRLWLDVLPGAVAVLGGLMLLGKGPRPGGKLGALLALAAGIWFAIGPDVSVLWNASGAQGAAHGGKFVRMLEMLGYHTLLGALIAALAGYALPGLVTRRAEAEAAAEAEETEAAVAARGTEPEARRTTHAAPTTPRTAPAPAAEPVADGGATGATPVNEDTAETRQHAVGSDRAESRTAVMDRPAMSESTPSTSESTAAPSESTAAPSESTAASSEPTAARQEPTAVRDAPVESANRSDSYDASNGAPAEEPTTVRRRSGGLLSRLRG